MDELTRKILTDEKLLANREGWFQKMKDIFEGESYETIYLSGISGYSEHTEWMYTDPEKWMEEVATNLAHNAMEGVSNKYFVPLGIFQSLYGVHFVDKIFGAEVYYYENLWYNRCLNSKVGELKRPDLEQEEAWRLAKRHAEAFLAMDVTVPVFGMPVISSALNIAVNLYGEEILVDMLLEPEAVHHDLQIINETLIEIHQWYREHIPMEQLQAFSPHNRLQPPGYGQICGCSTQLLSPEIYEEFIMPLDDALLGAHPNGGMIHLCGSHKQLIPLFARMENLKCVQINDRAAEDLEYYVQGLREDQVIYLYPCKGMPIERALEIAGNKRMVIVPK